MVISADGLAVGPTEQTNDSKGRARLRGSGADQRSKNALGRIESRRTSFREALSPAGTARPVPDPGLHVRSPPGPFLPPVHLRSAPMLALPLRLRGQSCGPLARGASGSPPAPTAGGLAHRLFRGRCPAFTRIAACSWFASPTAGVARSFSSWRPQFQSCWKIAASHGAAGKTGRESPIAEWR